MALTIDQLFTPAQSGVGLNPNVTPAGGTWLSTLISTAQQIGLPTTSWQPGAPERTILSAAAVALAQEDVVVSIMAQGGFLDFAASGSVTSVAINGVSVTIPVTPDPSIPSQNPTGAPGWLDALGQSYFDVTRLQASYAAGRLFIVNSASGATTLNYVAGSYHVANGGTGATYVNTDDITILPSAIAGTGGVVTGVAVGTTTTITTQSPHGLAANSVVFFANVLGVVGLNGFFGTVVATPTTTTFTMLLTTTGAWTSGGNVFLCASIEIQADVLGISGNAAPGQISTTITPVNGVFVTNLSSFSAANFESNLAYAARCRLSLAARSPNGPANAYDYFALTAFTILADQSPPVALTNGPIVQATTFSNPQTEVVTPVVRSETNASSTLGQPVTPGCAQLPISSATNASPIVVTTTSAHTLSTDDVVIISGVLGNTAANGAWQIVSTGTFTFSLNSSTGSAAYTGGGQVEGGDLGQVDAIIQANAVPDGITAVTESALAFPIDIVAVVVVPQAFVSTYTSAAPLAIAALFATYPIGGNPPPGSSTGTVPYSAVEGALTDAGVLTVGQTSYVRQVTSLTINSGVVDLDYPAPEYVAIVGTTTITVVGV